MLVYRSRSLMRGQQRKRRIGNQTHQQPPAFWKAKIRQKNEELACQRVAFEDYQNKVVLTVRSPSYFSIDPASGGALLMRRVATSSTADNKKNETSVKKKKSEDEWEVVGGNRKVSSSSSSQRAPRIHLIENDTTATSKTDNGTRAMTMTQEVTFVFDSRKPVKELFTHVHERLRSIDSKLPPLSSTRLHVTKRTVGNEKFQIGEEIRFDSKKKKQRRRASQSCCPLFRYGGLHGVNRMERYVDRRSQRATRHRVEHVRTENFQSVR